jgi:hypothetical protein
VVDLCTGLKHLEQQMPSGNSRNSTGRNSLKLVLSAISKSVSSEVKKPLIYGLKKPSKCPKTMSTEIRKPPRWIKMTKRFWKVHVSVAILENVEKKAVEMPQIWCDW